jgi:hypothetical protein
VLPGSIPLVLGMCFLGEVAPTIDWAAKRVFIDGKELPRACLT